MGASANLDGARNGLWFALRPGSQTDRELQATWTACGEAAFPFEVLETLDPDVTPMRVGDLLEQKKGEWAQRLGASTPAVTPRRRGPRQGGVRLPVEALRR